MKHGKKILSLLKTIEGNGSFAAIGAKDLILPGLQVGEEDIGLPITPLQAQALIRVAHQAPFGKGSETVTDIEVRNAWEIDADQITFKNPKWKSFLKKLLKEVKEELGIEDKKVKSELYKLLIYEEGGFFLPHKDSEKAKGMFATLVLALPSAHTGGEFHVRFDGREEVVDFSHAADDFEMPYVAFYADCEHEIKPVTSGYRVCLVYNLIQKSKADYIPSPQFSSQAEAIAEVLKKWAYSDAPFPQVLLLDHEYTPTNFSRSALKHHDLPRVEALVTAAEQAGWHAVLGLVTHYQMGELESDVDYYGGGYGRGRYRSWDRYDDEEVTGTMGDEIYEEYTSIEHWSGDEGPKLGALSLSPDEVIAEIEIGEGEPSEQEAEGYTGNAGMTMEYWYHYGAVVLWPHSQHYQLLERQPVGVKLDWIAFYLKHWDNAQYDVEKESKQLLTTFTEENLERTGYQEDDFGVIVDILIKLDSNEVFQSDGQRILAGTFKLIPVSQWVKLFAVYAHKFISPIFEQVGNLGNIFELHHLLCIVEALKSADYQDFVLEQVSHLPDYLTQAQLHHTEREPYTYISNDKIMLAIKGIFAQTLTFSRLKDEDEAWSERAFKSLSMSHERIYVNDFITASLLAHSDKTSHLYLRLYELCIRELAARVAAKPQPPKNWKMKVPKSSYYGSRFGVDTWELLADFLRSPTDQIFDYVANQNLRDEVSRDIRNKKIDLEMEIIRKGRPYTLRITKTRTSYKNKVAKWEEDVALEAKLRKNVSL